MTSLERKASAAGTSSLVRPIYSAGLLLEDEDLTASVDYARETNRLLFSSLFGCGVICGLKVEAEMICQGQAVRIAVQPGLGLDCAGNPIRVPIPQQFEVSFDCKPAPEVLWVTACHVEKLCRPRDVSCSWEDDDGTSRTATRAYDGFEIWVTPDHPACACSCAGPREETQKTWNECPGGAETPKRDRKPSVAKADGQKSGKDDAERELMVECYQAHFEGECACGCGCDCILIGRLTLTDGGKDGHEYEADDRLVRKIRPLLRGWYQANYANEAKPGDPRPEPLRPA